MAKKEKALEEKKKADDAVKKAKAKLDDANAQLKSDMVRWEAAHKNLEDGGNWRAGTMPLRNGQGHVIISGSEPWTEKLDSYAESWYGVQIALIGTYRRAHEKAVQDAAKVTKPVPCLEETNKRLECVQEKC